MRARVVISVIAVAISACGGTVVETTSPVVSSSSVAPATTTAATTTKSPATTTSTTVIAADIVEPLEIPRLDNGLPATFVGVTYDGEAVEVDTPTGEVLRSIGRMERPNESDDEGGGVAAIQQVWRTSEQSWYVVSECCEPAAGTIHYVEPAAVLTPLGPDESLMSFGWTVAPSPFDDRLVTLGYVVEVSRVGSEPEVAIPLDQGDGLYYPSGVAAWDPDGSGISWLSEDWDAGRVTVVRLALTEPDAEPTSVGLDWVAGDQWLDGLGARSDGNLVAFRNTPDDDPESPAAPFTEGVVFSTDGEIVATFPVEAGSLWGGYDPSGRFLIYTDGDNNVRWQGLGQSGELAEGFIHASW